MQRMIAALLVCGLACVAHASELPRDGNGLLDSCNALIEAADNRAALTSLTGNNFAERLWQVDWCAGYLSAVQDVLVAVHVNMMLMPATKVTLEGPEKVKAYWLDNLNVVCMPDDKIPILQMARVLVKWLREHPERLHELKGILTVAALRDAFPCEQPSAKETPKQNPAKP